MSGSASRELFALDDGVTYLDHGSFGLVPREVLAARMRALRSVESAPAPFFSYGQRPAWRAARDLAAARLRLDPGGVALVDNATDAVNAVLRSFTLRPGDEILLSNLTYGAVALAARHAAERQGARIVRADLRFPDARPEQCIEAVRAAITPRTRLAILDHVTSSTALVLPLAEMIAACRARGVAVLADGAHAPGHLDCEIAALGADWYVANLHKWHFVPRSCGILWAARGWRESLRPNALSWDSDLPFPDCFAWIGTRDPSAWMCLAAGFAFMDRFGEARARARGRALLQDGAAMLRDAWGSPAGAPEEMTGCMTLVRALEGLPFAADDAGRLALQQRLWADHRIVVNASFAGQDGRLWLRVSANLYNDARDYETLAQAVLAWG